MKVLLKAFTQSEYVDGANCLLLDVSEEQAKELLSQRELFQMAQSKSKGLYAFTFWNIPGEFYDVDEDALHERLGELASKFETDQYVVVPNDFTVYDGEDDEDVGGIRTEIDLTLIIKEGTYFRAAIKHSSTYVESSILPFELLLKGK